MNLPVDIHTHCQPEKPGTAILSVQPRAFRPLPGGYYSVGIHPWSLCAGANEGLAEKGCAVLSGDDFDLLRLHAAHRQVVAIGESGMDKLIQAPLSLQTKVFRLHAELAEELGKPLIIHLVKATDELLALKRELSPSVPWVIHGFRGKPALAADYIRHGFYLSFGMKCQDEALRSVPADRLFLETDDDPLPVASLYERAASVRGVSLEQLQQSVLSNIRSVFFPSATYPSFV